MTWVRTKGGGAGVLTAGRDGEEEGSGLEGAILLGGRLDVQEGHLFMETVGVRRDIR